MAVIFDYILGKLRLQDSSGGGGGTVTSVGLGLPSNEFTISGSPVVGSGTLTGTWKTQAANTVFVGPSSGAAATPTFRLLAISDIPSLIGAYAVRALSNLTGVAINTALLPGVGGAIDFGSTMLPWGDLFFSGSSTTPVTNRFRLTGVSTGGLRTITLPDGSGTVALNTVAFGGTGVTTLAAYAVLCGGTTPTGALQQVSGLGTTGFILTSNGAGALPTWQASGTSYSFTTGLTNTAGTITANISTGVGGGQIVYGGTGATDNLRISSTIHATKGNILFGNSLYDEVTDRLAINVAAGNAFLTIAPSTTTYASLLIKRGSTPTIPGDGGIWFDLTPKSFIINYEPKSVSEVHMEAIPGVIFTQTQNPPAEIVNDASEQSLFGTGIGVTTVRHERLTQGKTIRITMRGTISTWVFSELATLRFKYMGITVTGITTFANMMASAGWFMTIDITRVTVGGSPGIIVSGCMLACDSTLGIVTPLVLADTTGNAYGVTSDVLEVTWQWNDASADNDIIVTNTLIEIKNQVV